MSKWITAEELLNSLESDEAYVRKRDIERQKMAKFQAQLSADEKVLVRELKSVGVLVNSVWDLVNRPNNYNEAVSVLKSHLTHDHHPRVLSGVVRSLAIRELRSDEELWTKLVELFRSAEPDSEIDDPGRRGLREAIIVALDALAQPMRRESLSELIKDFPEEPGINLLEKRLGRLGRR